MADSGIAWAHTTFDSSDPSRAAHFWGRLLKLDPVARADGWFVLGPATPGGPMLYFQPTNETKIGKARVHIDLWVEDLPSAIQLVEELGGSRVGELQKARGGTIIVMADTEDTEFCLITF